MSDRPCTQIELEVDVGSEPITGLVSIAAGPAAPFSGWIELTEAIEAARTGSATDRREPEGPEGRKLQGGTLV